MLMFSQLRNCFPIALILSGDGFGLITNTTIKQLMELEKPLPALFLNSCRICCAERAVHFCLNSKVFVVLSKAFSHGAAYL